jgi:hypothetical protein
MTSRRWVKPQRPPCRNRRRFAVWLVSLALGFNLLLPSLCLAQMLAAGPLGSICSASPPGTTPAAQAQPDAAAGTHPYQHCAPCSTPAMPIGASPAPPLLAVADAAPWPDARPAQTKGTAAWLPPPRGPPVTA